MALVEADQIASDERIITRVDTHRGKWVFNGGEQHD